MGNCFAGVQGFNEQNGREIPPNPGSQKLIFSSAKTQTWIEISGNLEISTQVWVFADEKIGSRCVFGVYKPVCAMISRYARFWVGSLANSLFYQAEHEPKNRGDRKAGTRFNVFAANVCLPPSLRQKRLMYSFNRMHLIANLVLLLLLPLAAIGNKFDATIVKTETDGGNCLLNVFAICLLD